MSGGVCVLLSGGGARGALQVAALERLAPRATAYAGTSVGAVHACAAASGRVEHVRAFWLDVDRVGVFMRRQLDVWNGLYSLEPLRRWMVELDALAPRDPLWVGTYDYARAEHRLLRVSGTTTWTPAAVWAAICCSASIPFQHEPARHITGEWLGDGGIDQPLPPVPPGEYDEVHAVFCVPRGPLPRLRPEDVSGPVEQFARALDHFVARAVARCHAGLRRYKRAHPNTRVLVYEPVSWAEVGATFDASEDRIRARLDHGRWMADHPVEIA